MMYVAFGLEEVSSRPPPRRNRVVSMPSKPAEGSLKTTIQRIESPLRNAKLRSGNTPAPKASGWPRAKPEPRSGRKSPCGSPNARSFFSCVYFQNARLLLDTTDRGKTTVLSGSDAAMEGLG